MAHILFVDAKRNPPAELVGERCVIIARAFNQFQFAIERYGVPLVLTLGENLGSHSGSDCLRWLFDQHMDGVIDLAKIERVIVPPAAQDLAAAWYEFASTFSLPAKVVFEAN